MNARHAVAAVVLTLAVSSSCGPPAKMRCRVASGSFATEYTATSGVTQACPAVPGEELAVQQYWKQSQTGDLELSSSRIGVMPVALSARASEDPPPQTLTPTGLGAFPEDPDAEDFCTAAELSPVVLSNPAVAEEALPDGGVEPARPAEDVSYAFRNLMFYVSPIAPGSQMTGELTYMNGACVQTYSVAGVWPLTGCGVLDGEGNPVLGSDGLPQVDDALCVPERDPDTGLLTNQSHLNSAFNVRCHRQLAVCVPAGPIPALK